VTPHNVVVPHRMTLHGPRVLHRVRSDGDPQHLLVEVLLLLQLKRLNLYLNKRMMFFTTMRLQLRSRSTVPMEVDFLEVHVERVIWECL